MCDQTKKYDDEEELHEHMTTTTTASTAQHHHDQAPLQQQQQQPQHFTWNNQEHQLQNVLFVNSGDIVLCTEEVNDNGKINTKSTPAKIEYQVELANVVSANIIPSSSLSVTQQNATTTTIVHDATTMPVTLTTAAVPVEKKIIQKKKKATLQMNAIGGVRFGCPRCGKDYSQNKNMRRHFRLECGQEPKYPCPYCQLRFKRNNQLKNHMISRHCLTTLDDGIKYEIINKSSLY